jgi:hypothetical protein
MQDSACCRDYEQAHSITECKAPLAKMNWKYVHCDGVVDGEEEAGGYARVVE